MLESLKNWRTDKRGFTLVELIISMLVFTIFIGVVSTVYISVTRSLRHASEVRKVYSEARFLMDKITQDVRLYTVDYECLNSPETRESVMYGECRLGTYNYDGQGSYLPLVSTDGLSRIVYLYENDELSVLELEWDETDSIWVGSTGYYTGFQTLGTEAVDLEDVRFSVYPLESPYSYSSFDLDDQYQPSVHVVIAAKSTSTLLTDVLTITLQSTISSRVYGVSF